jgi:hypothetical protein
LSAVARPGQDGIVPEPAAQSAERKRCAREAARRREAVNVLRIAENTCGYAAGQIGNGAGPGEAREVAVFVAGELELVAEALRRLTRLEPGERRVMAAKLAGLGFGRREIAARLGVSERAVFGYLRHGAGQSTPV